MTRGDQGKAMQVKRGWGGGKEVKRGGIHAHAAAQAMHSRQPRQPCCLLAGAAPPRAAGPTWQRGSEGEIGALERQLRAGQGACGSWVRDGGHAAGRAGRPMASRGTPACLPERAQLQVQHGRSSSARSTLQPPRLLLEPAGSGATTPGTPRPRSFAVHPSQRPGPTAAPRGLRLCSTAWPRPALARSTHEPAAWPAGTQHPPAGSLTRGDSATAPSTAPSGTSSSSSCSRSSSCATLPRGLPTSDPASEPCSAERFLRLRGGRGAAPQRGWEGDTCRVQSRRQLGPCPGKEK